jgi:hypothetical protein
MSKRRELESLIAEPYLDAEGVTNANAHLDAFFALLGEVINSPMITGDNTVGLSAPGVGKVVCAPMRPGSPVRVLQKQKDWVQVDFLGVGCSKAPPVWVPSKNVEIPLGV